MKKEVSTRFVCAYCTSEPRSVCAISLDFFIFLSIMKIQGKQRASLEYNLRKGVLKMIDYRAIEKKLLKEIEEEKGFSFKKLMKIISLDGLYREMQ